jgi:putative ABC transport system ATP-binding protein
LGKIIEVKDLYKLYKVGDDKVKVLNKINLNIREGEFVAIMGPSGSGKSTLLNMLAGLEKPTKGEIVIQDEHLENMTEEQLVTFRRDHVGFVFQSFHLMDTMTAVENVALPLMFRRIKRKEREKKAKKMLVMVDLPKHFKHMPNQMSGGQRQRVSVARALVTDSKIIFADEPTGNLDSKTSEDVMDMMRRIVDEQGKTVIMVTHDNELARYADRIFHIRDGEIVQIEEVNNDRERDKIV